MVIMVDTECVSVFCVIRNAVIENYKVHQTVLNNIRVSSKKVEGLGYDGKVEGLGYDGHCICIGKLYARCR